MFFRRIAISLVFVIAVTALVGCNGGASTPTPPQEKKPTQEESLDEAQTETPSKEQAEDFVEDYGEKDWLASGAFAEYIGEARTDKTESWYHSLDAFPEIRKGNEGPVGIIILDIIPSEKDKTEEVLRFYTEAALGCPDPKIDTLVILDKKGNILIERKNQ